MELKILFLVIENFIFQIKTKTKLSKSDKLKFIRREVDGGKK